MAQITGALAIREIEQIVLGEIPHLETRAWAAAGVECRRDRHRYTGPGYAFSIEILRLRFSERGRSAWEALIVTERWSGGVPETAVRGVKWLKLVSGQSADLRAWMRRHRPRGIPLARGVADGQP